MAPCSYIHYFGIGREKNEPEHRFFFGALNKMLDHYYDQHCAHIKSIQTVQGPDHDPNATVLDPKNFADVSLCQLLSSGKSLFSNLLHDIELGNIQDNTLEKSGETAEGVNRNIFRVLDPKYCPSWQTFDYRAEHEAQIGGEKAYFNTIKRYIEESRSTAEAKQGAIKCLEEGWNAILNCIRISHKIVGKNFFQQWAHNKLNYPKALFYDPKTRDVNHDAVKDFFDVFAVAVGMRVTPYLPNHLQKHTPGSDVIESPLLKIILHDFQDLVVAHEQDLARSIRQLEDAIAASEKEQRRREQAEAAQERRAKTATEYEESARNAKEAARKQAEEAKQRQSAFMAKHQPYVLHDNERQLLKPLDDLAPGAVSKGGATALLALIEQGASVLDIRQPVIRKLGASLFGERNILTAVEAGGFISQLSAATQKRPRGPNSAFLETTCGPAAIAKQTIESQTFEKMLHSDGGTLMLACATLRPEAVRSYASTLIDTYKKVAAIDARLNALEDDERALLHEVANDPGYEKDPNVKLLKDRGTALEKIVPIREEIAKAIRAVVVEGRGSRSACAKLPGVPVVQKDIPSPSSQFTAAKSITDEFSYADAPDEKQVRIYNRTFPIIYRDVKPGISPEQIEQRLNDMRQDAALATILRSLKFDWQDAQDGLALVHEEYGLNALLPTGNPAAYGTVLRQVSEEASARYFQQEKDRQHVQIGELAPNEPAKPSEAQPADDARESHINEQSTQWCPSPERNLLIFDSGPLGSLAAPRAGGNSDARTCATWLDLVRATAHLPNTSIVIPAVVEWEMTGAIPKHNDKGQWKGTKMITEHPHAELFKQFLSSASHGRLVQNGSAKVVVDREGADNIIVIETPEDKALFDRIQAIRSECPKNGDPEDTKFKERMAKEIYRRNHGENAIERLVQHLPVPNPMTIISNDMVYLNNGASRTSGQGAPVAHASMYHYLAAEAIQRAGRPIHAKDPKGSVMPPLQHIVDELKAHAKKHSSSVRLFVCSKPGRYAQGKPHSDEHPQRIEEVIACGHRLSPLLPSNEKSARGLTPGAIMPHTVREQRLSPRSIIP